MGILRYTYNFLRGYDLDIIDDGYDINDGRTFVTVNTYNDLPSPTGLTDTFYVVLNSIGTEWLPGSVGGTFYSKGFYYSNGVTWEFIGDVPYQATQEQTNAGILNTVFVTPNTLKNFSGLITYSGTTNRIVVTGNTIDIASTYSGQTSINTVGGITTGSWSGTPINEIYGGTNQTSYTIGDILYASNTNTLSKLPGNSTNNQLFLSSIGTGTGATSPSWQPLPQFARLSYYLTSGSSDVSTYYRCSTLPQLLLSSISFTNVVNNQLLLTYITDLNYPNSRFIPDGEYSTHFHASKESGTRDIQIRAEVWETTSLGVDIVKLVDLGPSQVILGLSSEYIITFSRNVAILSSETSRIAIKYYAIVSTSGSAPHIVMYQGDGTDSRLNLPALIISANNYLPYTGATSNLNLGSKTLTTSSIGIGKIATTNNLEVEGNASKTTAGSWLANSDERLKKDINQINSKEILEKMLKLKGVTFNWNDNVTGSKRPVVLQYGFTAQNIKEVFPILVEEDSQGYLQTPYGTYDAMLIECIRELKNQIDLQQSIIENLKNKIENIN